MGARGSSTQPRAPGVALPNAAHLVETLALDQPTSPSSSTFRVLPRPETNEADTPTLKEDARTKVALLKGVLGAYFSEVESDLFNFHRPLSDTSESIVALIETLPASLHGLMEKPRWLLFTSRASSTPKILPTPSLVNGSPVVPTHVPAATAFSPEGGNPEEDLMTWLTWHVLRLCSALKFLTTGLSAADTKRPTGQGGLEKVQADREELRSALESMVVALLETLTKSAVRIPWRGAQRDDPTKDGGVGKARDVVEEMIRVVQGLLPAPYEPTPTYPRIVSLFEPSTSYRSTSRSPSKHQLHETATPKPPSPSIELHSSGHARCLASTTLDILVKATSKSIFLSEYRPVVVDLLTATWPTLSSFRIVDALPRSIKGEERADESHDAELSTIRAVCAAEWLDLARSALDQRDGSIADGEAELLLARVAAEFEARVEACDSLSDADDMAVDQPTSITGPDERSLATMLDIFIGVYGYAKRFSTSPPAIHHLFTRILTDIGDRLVNTLFDPRRPDVLRASALLVLAFPLSFLPADSGSPTDRFPSPTLRALDHSLQRHPERVPKVTLPIGPLLDSAYDLLLADHDARTSILSEQAAVEAQQSNTAAVARKRRRLNGPEAAPSSDGPDAFSTPTARVRRKEEKSKEVAALAFLKKASRSAEEKGERVLAEVIGTENAKQMSLQQRSNRLLDGLSQVPPDATLILLHTIGHLACILASPPASEDEESGSTVDKLCAACDSASEDDPTGRGPEGLYLDVAFDLDKIIAACDATRQRKGTSGEPVRLAALQSLRRIVRHTRLDKASTAHRDGKFLEWVFAEMESTSKSVRTAAGNVTLASFNSSVSTSDLLRRVDRILFKSPGVTETTVRFISRLAKTADPQSLLEAQCIARLLRCLGTGNTFLNSLAKMQLAQLAEARGVRPYALAQPHFATLAPVIVSTKTTLKASLDCFHQSRDALLRVTRDHTVPQIILSRDENYRTSLLTEIARASGVAVAEMLCDPSVVARVVAKLYMEDDVDRDRGVGVLQKETLGSPIGQLIESAHVPTVFALALELGDDDDDVQRRAGRALINVEKTRLGDPRAKPQIGEILQNAIVGILSYMNNGLREASSHRPLRDKQKIIRSLSAVTLRVGSGISGFSPQIMATLQTALASPGLRMAALEAFRSFMTSGKFRDIGVFVGPTSSSFVHIWPELAAHERVVAAQILGYIVEHAKDLPDHIHEVADLSNIPELAPTSDALRKTRKRWGFKTACQHLLTRVRSENDVVSLEGLKELRTVLCDRTGLEPLSFGDSFDPSIGQLVECLLAAAVKDGSEYDEIRNVACECIGILGAVDPDRFELPPVEQPPVVLENFENHDESIRFALRLLQDLLVGAYRSTNDTKHQEFLAFAIQELLRFCGFTASNVGPTVSDQTVDSTMQHLWQSLPDTVKQACSPLLSTQFGLHTLQPPPVPAFPIYLSTSSFRDWSRSLAYEVYRKIQGVEAREIFSAFDGLLQLEDTVVAQYLLPHLVLSVLICGTENDRTMIRTEMEVVLTDQVSPTHTLPENSRLLAAQTVFSLMDHLSRWITLARKRLSDLKANRKKNKTKSPLAEALSSALISVEGILQDIPHILVGQAALTCKSYARSLLNFESHIIAKRAQSGSAKDKDLQAYYENLHECYADLDEPDGMEGISTKILSPSILHQIREHESTGRWTAAQSCWEVKLQRKPDDPSNHVGLLRCLRNLGHYDSMRTHIAGLLSSRGNEVNWGRILAPFNIEASLFVSDWDAVERALEIPDLDGPEAAFGRVLCAIKAGDPEQIARAFHDARDQLGGPIVAAGRESYRRVYDSIVHLHVLHELREISSTQHSLDRLDLLDLDGSLRNRLNKTSPSFRAREPILNLRRIAFRLAPPSHDFAQAEVGQLWLETSKIARKAGHSQTAYSAILQARDCSAEFAFYQSAKLLKAGGQAYKAIQELENSLKPLLAGFDRDDPQNPLIVAGKGRVPPGPLAKAALRRARWMLEAGRVEHNTAIALFKDAGALASDWESPLYYLGHYWDQVANAERNNAANAQKGSPTTSPAYALNLYHVVRLYSQALACGTKFIYQALPRLLTIWLETAENPGVVLFVKIRQKDPRAEPPSAEVEELFRISRRMTECVLNCAGASKTPSNVALPVYQWLTVLPQLVSRVLHPNETVTSTLETILVKVLRSYPHHGFWAMASGAKSMTRGRAKRNMRIFSKVGVGKRQEQGIDGDQVGPLIEEGLKLVEQLLFLCDYHISGKIDTLSLQKTFPDLYKLAPTKLIIPLQSSLTVTLPFDASRAATHKPFPDNLPAFHSFDDQINIMSSLQKPRKITVRGDDGRSYSFLCKPKDDLRKDARLMEFNAMIIKLLKKDSEARSRKLNIRTYSVVPLNEECGLIEWVPHVVVLRGVLNKAYTARGIASWSPELKKIFDTIRDVPKKTGERFEKEVLSSFPPVFHDWFLETFPEPSAWHRARLAYSRTAAVISMVGFVLGLGDRHCENILLDGTTGDTVHVDFNCLFDKGRTFEVAEKVPFRLTANIIDGMGVTGVEGVYRRSAEIALRILRANQDSLRSVLETFLHDPLVEWIGRKSRDAASAPEQTKLKALESLEPISNKLRGLQVTSDPKSLGAKEVSVEEQVERLIREARDPSNLGSMYVGWCAWY
ncbi:hypothetical protein JCM10212_007012 [Sporobolomyces blumeae]